MFFIMGMSQGEQQLDFSQPCTCGECGRQGHFEVFMTYMYLSFFFIPLFKWNRRYYVKTTCCDAVYELDPELGRQIADGYNVEISYSDMVLVQSGRSAAGRCGGTGGWQENRNTAGEFYEDGTAVNRNRQRGAGGERGQNGGTAQPAADDFAETGGGEQKMLGFSKICPACGYQADGGFEYCPMCGRKLAD